MAKVNVSIAPPTKEAQVLIMGLLSSIISKHSRMADYHKKMEAIDIAYARYSAVRDGRVPDASGKDADAATTPVGVFGMSSTTPPVVVSQVDSAVAYLAEVFLSGSPLFPIVSSPANAAEAETLESLIDDHATLGGYARQLLMFLKDGVKYNFAAIEENWESISQYSLEDTIDANRPTKLKKASSSYTKIKRLNPYNVLWDYDLPPGDVSSEGDYAGYVEVLSEGALKKLILKITAEGGIINAREAMALSTGTSALYKANPQISDYISSNSPSGGINYKEFILGVEQGSLGVGVGGYEVIKLYARIIPSSLKLMGAEANTPQIWKFVIVNQKVIIQATRVISAYDYLPILFGQPLEDGMGYQTQSVAEGSIPFQQAASTLLSIRFNAARRAVGDRALYDKDLISAADINAPVPAAKIPVKSNSLDGNKTIRDAYHQIPFDARGTETAVQDAMTIVGFGKELSGLNNPMQGKFQKGNKSVQEWNDTMGGADARLRLLALSLEAQVFMPLKELIKLNIFQYGEDAITVSQRSGKQYDVKIAELRKKVLSFRVADGYTPKSKLASTESIGQLMQIIGQSQMLQQAYGGMLPAMFAHLAQLMGVRGLEEYTPQAPQPAQPQPPQQPQQPQIGVQQNEEVPQA